MGEPTGLLERPVRSPSSLEWPAGLCLQSKFTDLIQSFKSNVFSIYCWSLELINFRVFSGNLLILSANGNIRHSIHRQ